MTGSASAEVAGLSYRAFLDALAERKIPGLMISGGDCEDEENIRLELEGARRLIASLQETS